MLQLPSLNIILSAITALEQLLDNRICKATHTNLPRLQSQEPYLRTTNEIRPSIPPFVPRTSSHKATPPMLTPLQSTMGKSQYRYESTHNRIIPSLNPHLSPTCTSPPKATSPRRIFIFPVNLLRITPRSRKPRPYRRGTGLGSCHFQLQCELLCELPRGLTYKFRAGRRMCREVPFLQVSYHMRWPNYYHRRLKLCVSVVFGGVSRFFLGSR